ncbi:MAG: methylenetetrahydrofolate dehydrogenase [Gemmiger sp.]|nr:methylenetetrahydrofolate dehydrogenase [Gemmiger sp.]
MKARIPKHREFIIDFPKEVSEEKANEGWGKLNQLVEDYKKEHNGQSVYAPTFIEDCEPAVKALQAEYGFTYTVQENQ